MYQVTYRKSPRDTFHKLFANDPGYEGGAQWYSADDAARYADAISEMCVYCAVIDAKTGKTVYDATNGEWLH